MVVHNSYTKANALKTAMYFRKKGYNCTVFKKGKGYGISVTRSKSK